MARWTMENEREAWRGKPTMDLLESARSFICTHEPGHEEAQAALDVLQERWEDDEWPEDAD